MFWVAPEGRGGGLCSTVDYTESGTGGSPEET